MLIDPYPPTKWSLRRLNHIQDTVTPWGIESDRAIPVDSRLSVPVGGIIKRCKPVRLEYFSNPRPVLLTRSDTSSLYLPFLL